MTLAQEFIEQVREALAERKADEYVLQNIVVALAEYDHALKAQDLQLMAKLFPGGVNHYEG